MKKSGKRKTYCGNCDNHNPYEHPTRIFCLTRYAQNKDPIVNTLWCCDEWTPINQECHCVREALKKKNGA